MKVNDYIITNDNIVFKIEHKAGNFVNNNRVTKSYHVNDCKLLTAEQKRALNL